MVSRLCSVAVLLPLTGLLTAADDDAGATPAPAVQVSVAATARPGAPVWLDADTANTLAAARAADRVYQRHLEQLRERLRNGDTETRLAILPALVRGRDPAVIPDLQALLVPEAVPVPVIVAAVNGLAAIGAVEADVALTKLLANDDPALRAAAANALGELRRSRPVDQRRMAKDAAALLSLAGATSLATKPDGEAGPILAEALRRAPLDVERRIAAAGLGRLGDQTQAQALIDALTDSDALVRVYAAESLAQLKHTAAVPWLLMAMEAGPAGEAAYEAFRALGGPDIGYRPGAGQLARSVAVDAGMAWWTRTGSKAAGN